MQAIAQSSFDYSFLSPGDCVILKECEADVVSRLSDTADNIRAIGNRLIQAKKRLQNGQYEKWVERALGLDMKKAQRFVNVAEKFPEATLCRLMQPTALYTLARPNTPEAAREKACEIAKAGTFVTSAMADEIVGELRKPKRTPVIEQNSRAVKPQEKPSTRVQTASIEPPEKPTTTSTTQTPDVGIEAADAPVEDAGAVEKPKGSPTQRMMRELDAFIENELPEGMESFFIGELEERILTLKG